METAVEIDRFSSDLTGFIGKICRMGTLQSKDEMLTSCGKGSA
jgi:hypothetical protein